MKVVVKNGVNAVIITFHTKSGNFESEYERTKFFRDLHGWKQIIPRNGKRYYYRRRGLLDEVPHIKVADSAFIVAMKNMEKIRQYFDEWANKVEYEAINIMMRDRSLLRQLLKEDKYLSYDKE